MQKQRREKIIARSRVFNGNRHTIGICMQATKKKNTEKLQTREKKLLKILCHAFVQCRHIWMEWSCLEVSTRVMTTYCHFCSNQREEKKTNNSQSSSVYKSLHQIAIQMDVLERLCVSLFMCFMHREYLHR